ncbi:MAG: RluA family pseudouridine synthase [Calditrichaeota bacterium]|nr:RluA family pseudouridine synthase [Calditrichota bacterium]
MTETSQFDDEQIFKISVPAEQERERLDQFLAERMEKISRAQIQKLIKKEKVTVNGELAKPSYQITGGDEIVVRIPPPKPSELLPENIPLNVLYEDKYLLVLHKPAGLVVHPAYGNPSGTLANALVYHSQQLSTLSGEFRPGIVHRLDKDTSGLLVVAKNDYVHGILSQQFAEHSTEREYRAFVWGHFEEKKGRFESFVTRSPKDRTRMTVSDSEGKLAITNYEVLEEFHLVSYLRLRLETGRTHQIRVHMAYNGHPVVGDTTYGGKTKQTISLNQEDQQFAREILERMPRQALHAKTLGFTHPMTGKRLRFDSELPEDMRQLLDFLKGS